MILAQHNCVGGCGRYKAQQPCAPAKKSVINMIYLLLSVSDWPIIMIGPGGFLLIVPHPFPVPVSVLLVVLQKEYITKLGCEKYFRRSHTEQRCRRS